MWGVPCEGISDFMIYMEVLGKNRGTPVLIHFFWEGLSMIVHCKQAIEVAPVDIPDTSMIPT